MEERYRLIEKREKGRSNLYSLLKKSLVRSVEEGGVKYDEIHAFNNYASNPPGPIGSGFIYNTPSSSLQFLMTLILFHDCHPTMKRFIDEIKDQKDPNVLPLVKDRVFKEIKVIDLGCGRYPKYANCIWNLGGDIFTADYTNSQEIKFFNEEMRSKHTSVDFNSEDAIHMLLENTKGKFDLVTQSMLYLTTDGMSRCPSGERLEEIAKELLKEGGMYLDGIFNQMIKVPN